MKKLIFLLAFVLRFYKLGQVPNGFSLQEINYGLMFSLPNNAFLLRLPYAILGLISIYLLYLLVAKIFSEKLAITSIFLMAILPWHIHLSRVYSPSLIYLNIFLLTLVVLVYFTKIKLINISKLLMLISIMFLVSLFVKSILNSAVAVNDERLLVFYSQSHKAWQYIPNKVTVGSGMVLEEIFNHLDFGKYFFEGQPRPRTDIFEFKKLYMILLPMFLIGLFRFNKTKNLFLLSIFMFSFPLISIVIYSSASLLEIIKQKRLKFLVLGFMVFESLVFFQSYFINNTGMDRVYKDFYEDMPEIVKQNKRLDELVLVNDRISNAKNIFIFFNQDLTNYEFRSFDILKENNPNTLYVDFLPGAPSPTEPLYGQPTFVDLVAELTDKSNNEKIIIYRYKK